MTVSYKPLTMEEVREVRNKFIDGPATWDDIYRLIATIEHQNELLILATQATAGYDKAKAQNEKMRKALTTLSIVDWKAFDDLMDVFPCIPNIIDEVLREVEP